MTTPVQNTPYTIICDAMQDAGLLQAGDEPSSEQLATNSRRLVQLIRTWQTQGIKLWLNVDTPVTLQANKGDYTFAPGGDVDMAKPLRVLQGYYLYASGVRRPLNVMFWNEWLRLSQVTQLGPINSYFVDKQQTSLIVHFWLVPDATEAAGGVAHVLLQVPVTRFTNLTETISFPDEWELALHWGLSAEICTGQPASVIQRCETRAEHFRQLLEDFDVEDAPTRFTPDPQMQYPGSFR